MMFVLVLFLLFSLLIFVSTTSTIEKPEYLFDTVVYGATPAGVLAAVSASKNNTMSVALIEPRQNIGGMVSGGLGQTDVGDSKVIGGLAREFFIRVGKKYNPKTEDPQYHFEPHVAEEVFVEMLHEVGVTVFFKQPLEKVNVETNKTISSIETKIGVVFQSKVFIDASYEGDLMAKAKVSYAWGRESSQEYSESYAGRLKEPSSYGDHQFKVALDPFESDGKTLLPMIYGGDVGEVGSADKFVQSYNFRMCLTTNTTNSVPIGKPDNYDAHQWVLLKNLFEKEPDLSINDVMIVSKMPNEKTDINNKGPISTDYINNAWKYPEANDTERERIWNDHIEYTKGFFWFLANDPSVPADLQKEVKKYGLAKDEFEKTNNWPHQLYVREARRMIGEYIMTQQDRMDTTTKKDTVGLGSYNIDTHNAVRFPQKDDQGQWWVLNEGDVERGFSEHFELPYRCLLPKKSEILNLLVPVCVSSSHIGYGCIRLEPQFMILGQASGTAAAIAIKNGVNVQDVDVDTLQEQLRKDGAYLTDSDIPPTTF